MTKRTKPTIFSAARDGIVDDIMELLMTGEIDVNDVIQTNNISS